MYRSYQKIDRRLTRVIKIGNVAIGGNNPIAVQTRILSEATKTLDDLREGNITGRVVLEP